jgi:hypothetical protein
VILLTIIFCILFVSIILFCAYYFFIRPSEKRWHDLVAHFGGKSSFLSSDFHGEYKKFRFCVSFFYRSRARRRILGGEGLGVYLYAMSPLKVYVNKRSSYGCDCDIAEFFGILQSVKIGETLFDSEYYCLTNNVVLAQAYLSSPRIKVIIHELFNDTMIFGMGITGKRIFAQKEVGGVIQATPKLIETLLDYLINLASESDKMQNIYHRSVVGKNH